MALTNQLAEQVLLWLCSAYVDSRESETPVSGFCPSSAKPRCAASSWWLHWYHYCVTDRPNARSNFHPAPPRLSEQQLQHVGPRWTMFKPEHLRTSTTHREHGHDHCSP